MYLELRKVVTSHCRFRLLPTKTKLVIKTIRDFYLVNDITFLVKKIVALRNAEE